jgi:hypothetical protein
MEKDINMPHNIMVLQLFSQYDNLLVLKNKLSYYFPIFIY